MNKTLFGLALLTYSWETKKKDILDSYLSLIASIITEKQYTIVNHDILKDDMVNMYGINIPHGAIESILRRMLKNAMLSRDNGEYIALHEKIAPHVKIDNRNELNNLFDDILRDLLQYSKNHFQIQFTVDEMEKGFIGFLKEFDLDLMFGNDDGETVLPFVKENKKAKYIIAKYITEIHTSFPQKFEIIVKLAKGHAIASLITYDAIGNYSGSLNDVDIYMDSPVIFNLIGLNGESNLKLSQELISNLKKNGAKIKIFHTNYKEVVSTLSDAIRRLETKEYEISHCSRIMRTAIREGYTSQQIQMKYTQLDAILAKMEIPIVHSPELSAKERLYQIDEALLQQNIENLYSVEGKKIPYYKIDTISRDVESISNIFKLRKQHIANSLKNSKAIFLTSNEMLAYAAKKFEKSEWRYGSTIPVCLTDIFLSTILWANYPAPNDNLNIKQLISECYYITDLDNRVLVKFYEDVDRMHNENAFTDEQYYLLRASKLTYSLLEKKTLNDIEEYTDKTPGEILQDIDLEIRRDLKEERNKTSTIDSNIRKFAKFGGKCTFYIIGFVIILLVLMAKWLNPKIDGTIFNSSLYIVALLLGIFGFLRWMEIIPTKSKIESKIENFIYSKLRVLITE